MQTSGDVNQIVMRVASTSLIGHVVATVSSEPAFDSDGRDAVHITVVFAEGDNSVSGDLALDTIVDIRQALQRAGEQRTAIINFTNEQELRSDVDPELGPSF